MVLFTEMVLFTSMWWGWEKKPEKKRETKEKIPVWLFSHPFFYDLETDCFQVSENAENKPNLYLLE